LYIAYFIIRGNLVKYRKRTDCHMLTLPQGTFIENNVRSKFN
jgi:hypothetical protein